ncbi:MAG: hypothetical protein QG602_3186, partial [Verrucomicrobiota bacterium]|nr:hypothetical protein [Verrucomicrobiota bacterium]
IVLGAVTLRAVTGLRAARVAA